MKAIASTSTSRQIDCRLALLTSGRFRLPTPPCLCPAVSSSVDCQRVRFGSLRVSPSIATSVQAASGVLVVEINPYILGGGLSSDSNYRLSERSAHVWRAARPRRLLRCGSLVSTLTRTAQRRRAFPQLPQQVLPRQRAPLRPFRQRALSGSGTSAVSGIRLRIFSPGEPSCSSEQEVSVFSSHLSTFLSPRRCGAYKSRKYNHFMRNAEKFRHIATTAFQERKPPRSVPDGVFRTRPTHQQRHQTIRPSTGTRQVK